MADQDKKTQKKKRTQLGKLPHRYRFCPNCDLLIAHQDEIEDILSRIFTTLEPEIVGNDYLVIGTVERATWKRTMQNQLPIQDTLDALHDFEEVVSFKPAWGWRR